MAFFSVAALNLQRCMFDAELVFKIMSYRIEKGVTGAARRHHKMDGERSRSRAQRPNVKVMNACDAWSFREPVLDCALVNFLWHPVETR